MEKEVAEDVEKDSAQDFADRLDDLDAGAVRNSLDRYGVQHLKAKKQGNICFMAKGRIPMRFDFKIVMKKQVVKSKAQEVEVVDYELYEQIPQETLDSIKVFPKAGTIMSAKFHAFINPKEEKLPEAPVQEEAWWMSWYRSLSGSVLGGQTVPETNGKKPE